MITYFHEEELDYIGDQLRPLFTYQLSGQRGDNICAFIGKMDVKTDHMVDFEDVLQKDFIWSPRAVNFIVEIFHVGIETAVLYQRALMNIITTNLTGVGGAISGDVIDITLQGDDIMVLLEKESRCRKLSVSIATVSPISGLIHAGINIDVDSKIPVSAIGLSHFGKWRWDSWAKSILREFCEFVTSVKNATVKVRSVS